MLKRKALWVIISLAAVVLMSPADPALPAAASGHSASAGLTVTVEARSTLALTNRGDAVSAYPVVKSFDDATGIVSYSVIDG